MLHRGAGRRVTLGAALAFAAVGGGRLSVAVSAASNIDIRGDWAEVAVAAGTQFPQVLHITSEDLNTGVFSGTDGGGATGTGELFTLVGVVSGSHITDTIAGGGYTANTVGTVSGTGTALTMSGTFTDSNHVSGTFTATLTRSAAVVVPTAPAATAGGATSSSPATAAPHVAAGNSSSSVGTDTRLGASSLAASITPPSIAFSSTGLAIVNAIIALAAMLFITFPAQLFNHTFQENYEEIRNGVTRRLPWIARLRRRADRNAKDRDWQLLVFALVVLGGGLFG